MGLSAICFFLFFFSFFFFNKDLYNIRIYFGIFLEKGKKKCIGPLNIWKNFYFLTATWLSKGLLIQLRLKNKIIILQTLLV